MIKSVSMYSCSSILHNQSGFAEFMDNGVADVHYQLKVWAFIFERNYICIQPGHNNDQKWQYSKKINRNIYIYIYISNFFWTFHSSKNPEKYSFDQNIKQHNINKKCFLSTKSACWFLKDFRMIMFRFVKIFTFTFMHLADAFIRSDLQCI